MTKFTLYVAILVIIVLMYGVWFRTDHRVFAQSLSHSVPKAWACAEAA